MSSQTTNLHLAKPDYSEAADIAVINSDMDLIDTYAGSTTTSLSNTHSSLAYIVGNTNTTGSTLNVGTYVYVKGHNTINEGLRKVTASIANNGNITTSNTTTCTGGGINDAYNSLNGNLSSKVNTSAIKNNLTTSTSGYVLDARQGKALNDKIGKINNVDNVYADGTIKINSYNSGDARVLQILCYLGESNHYLKIGLGKDVGFTIAYVNGSTTKSKRVATFD